MISVDYNFSPWSQPWTTIKAMRSLLNLRQDSLMVHLSLHHFHIFAPRSFHRLPLRCHFLPRSYFREKIKTNLYENMKFNFLLISRWTAIHFLYMVSFTVQYDFEIFWLMLTDRLDYNTFYTYVVKLSGMKSSDIFHICVRQLDGMFYQLIKNRF